MVLRWFYSGSTVVQKVVLQWFYSGTIQWFYGGSAVVLQWFYKISSFSEISILYFRYTH